MKPEILLRSNLYFDFSDPESNTYDLHDIACALAKINRFNGHTTVPYSVAQHSVHVSHIVPKHLALKGLLHDGAEAYLGDMTRPLKQLFPGYKALETRIQDSIFKVYGCTPGIEPEIIEADLTALVTEKRDLQPWNDIPYDVPTHITPLEAITKPWPYLFAETQFIARFIELTTDA